MSDVRETFDKSSNIKFDDIPCGGSRIIPCGQTDMSKLTAAFRNFANTHNNNNNNNNNECHDNSVRIVTRPWAQGPKNHRRALRFSLRARDLAALEIVSVISVVYMGGTGALSLEVKRAGRSYHTPSTTARVKNEWRYTATTSFTFVADTCIISLV